MWLILLSFGSVERGQTAECKKCSKWLKYKTLIPNFSSWIDSQCWTACQVCSGWTPRPDPLGVVQGEPGLVDLLSFGSVEKRKNCRFQIMHKVIEICNRKVPVFSSIGLTPKAGQPVRHLQGGLLGRICSALYRERLVWLILLSFGSVEKTADFKKSTK